MLKSESAQHAASTATLAERCETAEAALAEAQTQVAALEKELHHANDLLASNPVVGAASAHAARSGAAALAELLSPAARAASAAIKVRPGP